MIRKAALFRDFRRDDTGASLILVMALLMFVGLVTAATLNYAQTSLGTTDVLEDRVAQDYDVDGALQTGINRIRTSDFISSESKDGKLVDPPLPFWFPGPDGAGKKVLVTFQPVIGTGSNGTAVTRTPNWTVLATENSGIGGSSRVDRTVGDKARIAGPLASNGSVDAGSGEIEADGPVRASGACSGSVVSLVGDKECSVGATATPSYTQPEGTVIRRDLPECQPGDVTPFEPGLYDDAAALSSFMNTECSNSILWFPGAAQGAAYFFDFRNGEDEDPPSDDEKVWHLNNSDLRVVVGGASEPDGSIPGSCPSPLTREDNRGAALVFGGASRLKIEAGQMEVCGPGDVDDPPIGIFGGTEDRGTINRPGIRYGPEEGPLPNVIPATLDDGILTLSSFESLSRFTRPPSDTASRRAQYDFPERIRQWDEDRQSRCNNNSACPGAVTATITNRNQTPQAVVSGFDPSEAKDGTDDLPSIEPDTVVEYAKVYVRHREWRTGGSAWLDSARLTVTPRWSDGTEGTEITLMSPIEQSNNEDWIDDPFRLPDSLLADIRAKGFLGATVTWEILPYRSGTQPSFETSLDSIVMVMKTDGVSDSAFRKQDTNNIPGGNCVRAGTCAMVEAGSSGHFHVQGTGYSELGVFDLAQDEIRAPVFASGLIGRQVRLNASNAGSYDGPTINRPRPLKMLIRAYTCTEPNGDCGDESGPVLTGGGWELAGTATATYEDPGGSVTEGSRKVAVESWWIKR